MEIPIKLAIEMYSDSRYKEFKDIFSLLELAVKDNEISKLDKFKIYKLISYWNGFVLTEASKRIINLIDVINHMNEMKEAIDFIEVQNTNREPIKEVTKELFSESKNSKKK
jgi:hypothetical protein